MKTKVIHLMAVLFFLFNSFTAWGQVKVAYDYAESQELMDYFHLERIEYLKLSFSGKELTNKTYHMSVKEIWDGEIKRERDIVNSRNLPYEQHKTVGDTIFNVRIISKLTADNKLKMDFHFPSFSTGKSFEATSSNIYSLRAVVEKKPIEIGENFYIMVYMLPYEVKIEGVGTMQQYCAVEDSGKEIETWGKEFGIKHYLVFEMKFESL